MELSTSTNITAFCPDGKKNPMTYSIELCAAAGYRVLDLNFCEVMNPHSRMRDDDWECYVDEIGELGARLGVKFTQSHLPYYDIFGIADDAQSRRMEEWIRRSLVASARLGVCWAVTHPGTVYQAGQDMAVSLRENLNYYAPHVETAIKYGVGIALENDFEYRTRPYQRIYCASVEELCGLVDAFHSSAVGVCYDFGHANLTGGFHRQNLNRIGSRLKAVHVQDNHGMSDEHLMPFFGNIDWKEAMAGLAEIGYAGELTYEIQEFGRNVPNELKRHVVELSLIVGKHLIALYEKALQETGMRTGALNEIAGRRTGLGR